MRSPRYPFRPIPPAAKAPPCIQAMTGKRVRPTVCTGAQMFSARQSSLPPPNQSAGILGIFVDCRHGDGLVSASRTRGRHSGATAGGWKRRDPNGGVANGMPKYSRTDSGSVDSLRPRTRPVVVYVTSVSVLLSNGVMASHNEHCAERYLVLCSNQAWQAHNQR